MFLFSPTVSPLNPFGVAHLLVVVYPPLIQSKNPTFDRPNFWSFQLFIIPTVPCLTVYLCPWLYIYDGQGQQTFERLYWGHPGRQTLISPRPSTHYLYRPKLSTRHAGGEPFILFLLAKLTWFSKITSQDPKSYNIQVQINNQTTISTCEREKGQSVAIVLVPMSEQWPARKIRDALLSTMRV